MKTSTELRAVLVALESDLEAARATFVAAQAAHRDALRAAIADGKKDDALVTEAALKAAQDEHARLLLARDMAKQMLEEAVERERIQAEAHAREEIEARLAGMNTLAREADEAFFVMVGKLRQLYAAEVETHRTVRDALGKSPWMAPRALTAAESLASFLRSLQSNPQDMKPWVEETMNSASQNIRGAMS